MKKVFALLLFVFFVLCSQVAFAEDIGVKADINTKHQGNVFFENEAKNLEIALENETQAEKKIRLDIYVFDEDGDRIDSYFYDNISVPAQGKINQECGIDVTKFGFYTLEVRIKDKQTNATDTVSTRFSYSKKALVKNANFGFNATAFSDMADAFDLIDNSGLGCAREQITWSSTETTAGRYSLTASVRHFIDSANEKGIDVLALLGAGNALYDVVNDEGKADAWYIYPKFEGQSAETIAKSNSQLEAFGNFVKYTATQLKNKVSAYQVWNEPLNESSNQTEARAHDFAKLQKTVYDNVKSVDKDSVVVGLCLNQTYSTKSTTWFGWALDQGAGDTMDVLSLHTYSAKQMPELSGSLGISTHMSRFYKILNQRTSINNIWVTEYGWSTAEDATNYAPEELQGSYLLRHYILNAAQNFESKHFIYNFENRGNDASSETYNYGLVKYRYSDIPYEAKPSYLEIANFNSLVGGAVDCEDVRTSQDKSSDRYIYKFNNVDGREVYAMWCAKTNSQSIDDGRFSENAKFYDSYGNEIGRVSTLSNRIVYAVENDTEGSGENEGKIIYRGNAGSEYAGRQVQIIVSKPGEEVGDMSMYLNPAYINYAVIDENGEFSFSFNLEHSGYHNVYLLMPDETIQHRRIKGNGNKKVEIFAYVKDDCLKELNQLSAGDTVKARAYLSENNEDAELVFAFYNGSQLKNVLLNSAVLSNGLSVSGQVQNIDFDSVKIFLWEKTTLKPIADYIPID